MRSQVAFFTGVLLAGSVVAARPGELVRSEANSDFELLRPLSTGRACLVRGATCLSAGGSDTVLLPAVTASADPKAIRELPAFRRTQGGDSAWALEIDSYLDRPALAGCVLFLVYDLADPSSIEQHEVTAMHQGKIAGGRTVAARLRLSPNDGFHRDHDYRLQIVQLVRGRELVLAQGDFSLR